MVELLMYPCQGRQFCFLWGWQLFAQWCSIAHHSQLQMQLMVGALWLELGRGISWEIGRGWGYPCCLKEPKEGSLQRGTAGSQLGRGCSLFPSHSGKRCPFISLTLSMFICVSSFPLLAMWVPQGWDQQAFLPIFCWVQPTGSERWMRQGLVVPAPFGGCASWVSAIRDGLF